MVFQNKETLSPSYILEVTLSSWSPAMHFPPHPRASKTGFLVHLQMCTPLAILLMDPLENLFMQICLIEPTQKSAQAR